MRGEKHINWINEELNLHTNLPKGLARLKHIFLLFLPSYISADTLLGPFHHQHVLKGKHLRHADHWPVDWARICHSQIARLKSLELAHKRKSRDVSDIKIQISTINSVELFYFNFWKFLDSSFCMRAFFSLNALKLSRLVLFWLLMALTEDKIPVSRPEVLEDINKLRRMAVRIKASDGEKVRKFKCKSK